MGITNFISRFSKPSTEASRTIAMQKQEAVNTAAVMAALSAAGMLSQEKRDEIEDSDSFKALDAATQNEMKNHFDKLTQHAHQRDVLKEALMDSATLQGDQAKIYLDMIQELSDTINAEVSLLVENAKSLMLDAQAVFATGNFERAYMMAKNVDVMLAPMAQFVMGKYSPLRIFNDNPSLLQDPKIREIYKTLKPAPIAVLDEYKEICGILQRSARDLRDAAAKKMVGIASGNRKKYKDVDARLSPLNFNPDKNELDTAAMKVPQDDRSLLMKGKAHTGFRHVKERIDHIIVKQGLDIGGTKCYLVKSSRGPEIFALVDADGKPLYETYFLSPVFDYDATGKKISALKAKFKATDAAPVIIYPIAVAAPATTT